MGPAETGPEVYRGFADAPKFPFGDNLELVHCPPTGATKIVPAGAARLIQSCRTFATLEEQAARLAAEFRLPPQHAGALREQLAALARDGLLASYRRAID